MCCRCVWLHLTYTAGSVLLVAGLGTGWVPRPLQLLLLTTIIPIGLASKLAQIRSEVLTKYFLRYYCVEGLVLVS